MIINNLVTPAETLNKGLLFLIFNRLDTTIKAFEAIKKAKPPRLYIAADGPRQCKEGEGEKVQATRDYVISNIDWPCDVKTLFREQNMGCKMAVSSAISWFFEHEEMGIILEDDCLAHPTFFRFCDELLEKYRDDSRVMHIGGFNIAQMTVKTDTSYLFSRYPSITGWATWRRAWEKFDVSLNTLDCFIKSNYADLGYYSNIEKLLRVPVYLNTKQGKTDSWGYCWDYAVRINSGLCIYPEINQIVNLGFNEEATHTKIIDARYVNCGSRDIIFPLIHPVFVLPSTLFDICMFFKYVSGKSAIFEHLSRIYYLLFSRFILRKYR